MNEIDFWKIVEDAGSPDTLDPDQQCGAITKVLACKNIEDLAQFHNIHKRILARAYKWNLIEACYITIHYVSDDVFEDFRNWIILNGRDRFERSIENPDYIATYMNVEDPVEDVTGEPLLYVCEQAFTGEMEELENMYICPDEPILEDNWPPFSVLKEKYPNLVSKYWDNAIEYEHGS